jgi:hypothetical protein
MTLKDIDKILDTKIELLKKLDQRIDANLMKINLQFENSRFKTLLK